MSESNDASPATSAEPVPAWMFWHPVPTWQVVLTLVLCEVALTSSMVGLRTQLGLEVPFGDALGGAAGGALAFAITRLLQRRRQSAAPETSSAAP